ncbi:DNA polymerase IV [Glaciecola petra]|uniref:DNA polymerase IV n=1 Tax=Glaciecola petra TaxID=3075602 RepID=A0ABU2ZV76_9ALTE|nr:DNA polymerase IV [Aestuariibacter sp. P117]MDT0596550.1 DNA polymerase IV [Aestuariibacter sp. P117]
MRKFIHVDMDAFYVSVEIRDNPILANKPVAVGGKSSQRGVLSTCNYLAREFGVRSAMPSSHAKRLCPDLIIVPGRMQVYQDVSTKIREIFQRYTQLIEPLSLDEAYLDVSDCSMFAGSATLIAQDIRLKIHQELGLTASAGIAPLKFLAKIASDMNKPNGQYLVKPDQVVPFIENLPLNKIPGVGKVTFAKLNELGWTTGKDIRALTEAKLADNFGKFGLSLWKKCQGIDNRGVETSRVRKSVAVERTFSENIASLSVLEEYLIDNLYPSLLGRAQKHIEKRQIDKLGVKIKFADFRQTTKEHKSQTLDKAVFLSLLQEAWQRRNNKDARLLGIFIGFTDKKTASAQLSLNLE